MRLTKVIYRVDAKSGLLQPSYATFDKPLKPLGCLALGTLSLLGLAKLRRNREGVIIASTNLTLINVVLVLLGPMKESTLTTVIMLVQVAGSVLAFVVRYAGASWFYQPDSGRR